MTPQGHQYFQMFMMTNQQRITDSLAQARRELEGALMEEAAQREFLREQILAERQALSKMKSGGIDPSDYIEIGRLQNTIKKTREQTQANWANDWKLPTEFAVSFQKALGDPSLFEGESLPERESIYKRELEKEQFKAKFSGLSPSQQKQAFSMLATDFASQTGQRIDLSMKKIGSMLSASEDVRLTPKQVQVEMAADLKARQNRPGGEWAIGKAKGLLKELEAGEEVEGESEAEKGVESRLKKLEDELENLALEPIRMEQVMQRAGEIHAPYMGKRKRELVKAAQTARAMDLPAWKKNYLQASRLSHDYSKKSEPEVMKKGAQETYGIQLANKILTGELSLEQAMGKIADTYEDKGQQERSIAALASVAIRKGMAQKPKPVKGEKKLVRELEKAANEAMARDAFLGPVEYEEELTESIWGSPGPERVKELTPGEYFSRK